ncbi:hypothetical protein KY386_03885 [Candidatus Parcubacteria bacterium]|nr:hypothetical protein [Candidatus Parcubacteria bacterium]
MDDQDQTQGVTPEETAADPATDAPATGDTGAADVATDGSGDQVLIEEHETDGATGDAGGEAATETPAQGEGGTTIV